MGNEGLSPDQQKIAELLLKVEELENKNAQLTTLCNPILVNSTIYQGLRIILEKITLIEQRLLEGQKEVQKDGKS